MSFPRCKKILWAADAYQLDNEASRNILAQIRRFAATFGSEVELVFAYDIPKIMMGEKVYQAFQRSYLDEARLNLERIAGRLKDVKTQVTVLSCGSGKARNRPNAVEAIADYAQKNRFDVVAVATHGRGLFTKLFMGSFAEGLFHQGRLPLLILGPHPTRVSAAPMRKILFPTDLKSDSHAVYLELLSWAKKRGFTLTLTHGLMNDYIPLILSDAALMGSYYPIQSSVFQGLFQRQKKRLAQWLEEADGKNILVRGEVDDGGGLISDLICRAVEKDKSDLIVMRTRAGRKSHSGMGSVTKKVVRRSGSPVLILRK